MAEKLFLHVETTLEPIIDYRNPMTVVGSCFADNIGQKLLESNMEIANNTWGTIYNPLSIANNLLRAVSGSVYVQSELQLRDDIWFSWTHHGKYSGVRVDDVLHQMNTDLLKAHSHLSNKDGAVIITFGSAWVYEKDGEIVANCHKFPNRDFQKRLLEVDEIVDAFRKVIRQISISQPIILTISPVRYIRDGLFESHVSKGVLFMAVKKLMVEFEQIRYFPAFEIVTDELRDYRFYADDLLHPNQLAINIVWERFMETYFNKETKTYVQEWQEIRRDMNHRLLHPVSNAAHIFKQKLNKKITTFENRYNIKVLK